MKAFRIFSVSVVSLMLLVSATQASMNLNVVEIPANSVTVDFAPTKGAPDIGLKAELSYKHGQARVEMHFSGKHQPAVLYGGDVTCYVIWAIGPDGVAANLGELRVTGDDESHHFRTPSKRFALVVTAEPYGLVRRPSELVVFSNDPPKKKGIRSQSMWFDGFARAPVHTKSSIADLKYDRAEPMNLIEARKAYELAGRNGAEQYAPDLFATAGAELSAAEELHQKGNRGHKFNSASRGSIDASAQAIHIATATQAAEILFTVIEERQARMDALEGRSEVEELIIATLLDRQADLEDEVGMLSEVLQDALATIADTRLDAAGVVLTLPEILFATNQAILTTEAEITLAKLSGVMLVFPQVGAAVGGYTDSTGNREQNVDLSLLRAEAVAAFLLEQGVDPGRLTAVGFGPEDPIADNSTATGRKENRRVEILLFAGIGG